MNEQILTIKAGAGIPSSLALAQQMLERVELGEEPSLYFSVEFKDMN